MLAEGAKLAGIPMSQNLLGAVASLIGSPVLGAVASFAGPIGFPIALAQLAHAISSNVEGTTASQINALMSNPHLTEEDVHTALEGMAARGAFPTTGGPQGVAGVPGSLQGPQGAAFGLSATNPSIASQNQNLSNMTLADIANAIFGGPRANDPIDATGGPSGPGPGGTASSPGASSPAGLGEGGPAGPGVSESGASVGTGNAAGVGGTGDAGTGAGDTGDGPGGAAGDY